jgi:hypothetical protein
MRLTPFGFVIILIIVVAVAARLTGMKTDGASTTSVAPAAITLPR